MGMNLEIVDESIQCSRDGERLWRTAISDVVLLAEYTTSEGPWGDDYFLLVKSIENGHLMEARVTDISGGFEQFLVALSRYWKTPLQLGLVQSTEWSSRVLWPPTLAGEKYFKLTPVAPDGFWERVKFRALGTSLDLAVTEKVASYLKDRHAFMS
jgi:hypothetical protein